MKNKIILILLIAVIIGLGFYGYKKYEGVTLEVRKIYAETMTDVISMGEYDSYLTSAEKKTLTNFHNQIEEGLNKRSFSKIEDANKGIVALKAGVFFRKEKEIQKAFDLKYPVGSNDVEIENLNVIKDGYLKEIYIDPFQIDYQSKVRDFKNDIQKTSDEVVKSNALSNGGS